MIAVDRGDRRGDRTGGMGRTCGPLPAELARFEMRSQNDEIPGLTGDSPSHRGFVGAGDRGVEPRVTVLETVTQAASAPALIGDLGSSHVPGDRPGDRTSSSLPQEDAMRDTAPTPAPVPTERQAVHSRAASARNPVVTESVARHLHFGRVTLGYKVALDDVPVFVGTSSECVTWADREMERGANWSIRDARGLVVDQEAWERRFAPGYGQSSHAEVVA